MTFEELYQIVSRLLENCTAWVGELVFYSWEVSLVGWGCSYILSYRLCSLSLL